jgi:hypothetical protein
MVDLTDSDKHPSLLRHGINYNCKMLHCTGPKVQVTSTGTSGAPLPKVNLMVITVFALKC